MELNEIRKKIDWIDFEILKLLDQRMELALRTKKMKKMISDHERELDVLRSVSRHSQALVKPELATRLFNELIEESKALQSQDIRLIGFQGEHGAYGETAARAFSHSSVPIPLPEFVDVFDSVENGEVDIGIVPVENSLEGAVTQVNDLLVERELMIVGEVHVPIHHCLLTLPDTDYREIKAVYSHPQALAQCRGFLSRNKLRPTPFYDTAGAAKMLSTDMPRAAAVIASKLCAELYNLEILKENIEDQKPNFTRFVVLSKQRSKEPGNKCSIAFSTEHRAGALFKVLKVFADAEINLTRIESRPLRNKPGRFAFLLDFQGSEKDDAVTTAMDGLNGLTESLKFLGCYREGSL